jgi:hypothetical protein
MSDAADITFRWIDGPTASQEDWDRIEAILASRGWMQLARATSRIRVAERDGVLLGFHVLQLMPHAEPLWVKPSERASGLADQLANDMLDFLVEIHARGWIVVADSPHAAKLCEAREMTKIESPVYVKVGG